MTNYNITNNFSYANAAHFAKLSEWAYKDKVNFTKSVKSLGYKDIMFFDKNGAQAYGIRFKDYVILAFRGTEPTQFSDIKADLRAFHVKNELGIGRVHKGFKNQVNHLWPEIEKWLLKKPYKQAYTCGHSLGAAMSTIATSRLPAGTICYNFGSPRTGTKSWVKEVNKNFTIHRFVNNNDIVTRVPPASLFFKHAGNLHYINTYGNIRNATLWQRFKDRFRGYRAAWKQRQFFDSLSDHSMTHYVKHISNKIEA